MDAADWLAERGQTTAEEVLRENMIETVADLAFLISSQSDMAKLGFAPVAQQDLWPDIEKLNDIVDEPTPTPRDDDEMDVIDYEDQPEEQEEEQQVEEEPEPAKKKKGGKKKSPQASGDYKADVGGKNDPRLGWGALADDADDTPKKKKGGKKKGSKAAEKAAEKSAAAAEKAAADKAKKEEAKAKRAEQKAADEEKAAKAKAKSMEARKKKKAAAAEKKKAASAKKAEKAAASPKPSAKKVKGASSRLSQPSNRGVGAETPKSEAEMSPKPKKGRGKPPRCAAVPLREEETGAAAEFSPRLDWEVQRKLLDKIEQETRRREHLEWLKQKREMEEEEAANERKELQATYNFELNGPAKLEVGTHPAVARAKQAAGSNFKMSPGSARLVGDDDGLSFVERQERREAQKKERMAARKREVEEAELKEVTAQPLLSKASLRMTKETIHASMSKEERIERLTSPVRLRSPPSLKTAVLATQALSSPTRSTPTPRRKKSKRLGSPQTSSVDRLSKTSPRDRLRKEGQAQATDLTFQPAINNSSRDMATRRRSPRGSPAGRLGSPSRSGVASALSSIKTNIKSVWDQPGGVNIEKLFEHYDKDQDGWLSFSEWTRAVRRDGIAVGSGQHLSDEEHRQIFDYVDVDADGYISLSEFRQFLQPKSRRRTASAGGGGAPARSSPRGARGARPSPRRTPIAPKDMPAVPVMATPEASGLGAPQPPPQLPAASAELIEHCAEWVARHGQQFETILKNRNFGQPGQLLQLSLSLSLSLSLLADSLRVFSFHRVGVFVLG